MAADILLAQQFLKIVAAQHGFNLGIDARQHDSDTFLLAHQTHVLQVVKTGRVDKRHLTHADDAHFGSVVIARHRSEVQTN